MMRCVMALCFAIVFWAALPQASRADYASTELFELVGTADLVATGEVTEVLEKTFVLKIEKVIIGDPAESVEIQQFTDWTCAYRWQKYAVGQRVLVFARKGDSNFVLPGAGGEAESPIVDDGVYCQFPCNLTPRVKFFNRFQVKVALKDLIPAIEDYRSCFHFMIANRRTVRIEQICTDAELVKYSETSSIHKMLVEQTKAEQKRLDTPPPPETKAPSKKSKRSRR